MSGITFQIKDAIDIILVAILMYVAYFWTRGTSAKNIFAGLIAFVLVWFLVTRIFRLELLGAILDGLFNVGVLAIIVIFQTEIRQFFSKIGSRHNWKRLINLLEKLHLRKKNSLSTMPLQPIVDACRDMSKAKTGALMVIAKNNSLQEYIDTGEVINATVNTRLIENIFFKNSPLHDGAIIIVNNTIVAAGAILPISRNMEIPKHLGLRHRAAIGVTERTDAVVVVVSEETGSISVVYAGQIAQRIPAENLASVIEEKLLL